MIVTISRHAGVRAGLLAAILALGACAEKETILAGQRLNVRTPLDSSAPADVPADAAAPDATAPDAVVPLASEDQTAGVKPVPLRLPGVVSNADWTHRAGSPAHRAGNVAFAGAGTQLWAASIGRGDSRRTRIYADPVVAGGRVFTLDADAAVTASGSNGGALWRTDLTPGADHAGDASGGGLAYEGGRVYATTGFGELVALDAASGAVVWRQKFDIAVGGAPTVADGMVFVAARDATAWAVRASDGKVQWQLPGTPARSGVMGVSAPAVSGGTVVFPFASGEMIAVDIKTGTQLWSATVAGTRLGRAYASVSDLTGDPVIADGIVFAGSAGGRLAAFDEKSGNQLWVANDGALSPPVVAGGAVFVVNDEDQLERLDAATGAVTWRIDLPYFTQSKDKKRKGIFVHYGPVLAGNRLWTASSDGYLRGFDPASGAVVAAIRLSGGAATTPVIAGGTLYVLTTSGQLLAFR